MIEIRRSQHQISIFLRSKTLIENGMTCLNIKCSMTGAHWEWKLTDLMDTVGKKSAKDWGPRVSSKGTLPVIENLQGKCHQCGTLSQK